MADIPLGSVPTSILDDADYLIFAEGTAPKKELYSEVKKDILGTATLNTNDKTIKGAINEVNSSLSGRAYNCNITNSSSIALASGVYTAIPFDTNLKDAKNMHNTVTNNTKVNILKEGNYNITGTIGFDLNSSGIVMLGIKVNGTNFIGLTRRTSAADTVIMQVTAQFYLNANDYIELVAFQSSGSSININKTNYYSPILSTQRVGD